MTINIFYKIIYNFLFVGYVVNEKILDDQKAKNIFADKFLKINNNIVLNKIKSEKPKTISILLPHCIQNYDCTHKLTSNVENCRRCGKCKINNFLYLKEKYKVDIKVATGGTLARKYIKEKNPDLIIAVACKRDLISGIYDAFPKKVYGVFNKIIDSPCINTEVNIDEIETLLKKFTK